MFEDLDNADELPEPIADRYVVFSHGSEGEPWGKKITALAHIARAEGFEVKSVDYRGVSDPRKRVTMLTDFCANLQGDLVLVGSSLGAYVAAAAAPLLHCYGLFLIAPAFYVPGIPELRKGSIDCPISVVHGWRDEVVPLQNALRFASEYRARLHIVDGDHQLHEQMRFIRSFFEYFLLELDLPRLTER
ncbi:MAG: alpha/beta hydrolase [Steroidobacteraceae bacterium]